MLAFSSLSRPDRPTELIMELSFAVAVVFHIRKMLRAD